MFKVRGPVGKTFSGFRDAVMAAPKNYIKIDLHDIHFIISAFPTLGKKSVKQEIKLDWPKFHRSQDSFNLTLTKF